MSPCASVHLGPPLHHIFRRWNVEDLFAHICLVVAVTAIIHHGPARLSGDEKVRGLFRRQVETPVRIGIPLLVATFVLADEKYQPNLFVARVRTFWFGAYWLVLGSMLVYLSLCAGRVLPPTRPD